MTQTELTGSGPSLMRAVEFAAFGGPEVLHLVETTEPTPGPGQIRVAVRACGVNPFDWKQRRGLFGGHPPIRVGVEIAGTVAERGPGAPDVEIGTPVYGFAIGGGAAEFALSSAFAPIPPDLDFPTAAAMPVAIETAFRVLDLVVLTAGSRLLLEGASGAVGQAVAQIAIARGVEVIGTASRENHSLLRDLGVSPLHRGPGPAAQLDSLGIHSVDAAINTASGGSLSDLVALTGDPQRVVTIVPDPQAAELGVQVSGGNSAFNALVDIAALLADGAYRPPAVMTFALEQTAAAQERSEAGQLRGHKLVLVP